MPSLGICVLCWSSYDLTMIGLEDVSCIYLHQGLLVAGRPSAKAVAVESTHQTEAGYDSSRQLIPRSIEPCHLGIEHMMYGERLQIEGTMQSLDIASEFCHQARFSPVET